MVKDYIIKRIRLLACRQTGAAAISCTALISNVYPLITRIPKLIYFVYYINRMVKTKMKKDYVIQQNRQQLLAAQKLPTACWECVLSDYQVHRNYKNFLRIIYLFYFFLLIQALKRSIQSMFRKMHVASGSGFLTTKFNAASFVHFIPTL